MSDDILSFFDDAPDSGAPAPSPSESPAPSPADQGNAPAPAASITPEQYADMQRRLDSADRLRADIQRVFGGEQQQQQAQQADPQALLQQFLTNPNEVLQNTAQQAAQIAQERFAQQTIMEDRRAKNPDIARIEHLIDWGTAMNNVAQSHYQKTGQAPSFAEALDGAIAFVKQNLQGQQPGAQQNPGGNASRMAMTLDISGGQNPGNRPIDPSTISDADWPKYREAYRRQFGAQ